MTPVSGFLRDARREQYDALNVLCCPTHERYEQGIARTGHRYYALQGSGIKRWVTTYAQIPQNYTILPHGRIPADLTFDVVLCQNRSVQYETLRSLADRFGRPLICLEHVLPTYQSRQGKGDLNVFISEHARQAWGYESDPSSVVIEHGVDTDTFAPHGGYRTPTCLSVVNDWVRRDAECGYNFWREATAGLPTAVLGDTPGLSRPAANIAELAEAYRDNLVFANTALVSPVPTTLLEAMSSGCCVVSTRNPMIESIITDGLNGMLASTPKEMRSIIEWALAHEGEALKMGDAARDTIVARFNLDRFVQDWQRAFRNVL